MTTELRPTLEGLATDIQDKLPGVTSAPGVYLMKDAPRNRDICGQSKKPEKTVGLIL